MNKKFPWGEVVKVHDIAGKYQITEYEHFVARDMQHVAQLALETLVDGYLSTSQVLTLAHDALAAGQFVAGLGGLGQLDAWEETSGLLKRQFYVAGQEGGEAAVLRNAYFGQFEGHRGYQLLISDEQDREIAMVPVVGVNSTHSTARLTHWGRRCCRLCATTTAQETVTCSATLTH